MVFEVFSRLCNKEKYKHYEQYMFDGTASDKTVSSRTGGNKRARGLSPSNVFRANFKSDLKIQFK